MYSSVKYTKKQLRIQEMAPVFLVTFWVFIDKCNHDRLHQEIVCNLPFHSNTIYTYLCSKFSHGTNRVFSTDVLRHQLPYREADQMNNDIIRKHLDKIIEWRHWLHSHPELSTHEKETSKYIKARLDDMGLTVKTGDHSYGLTAVIEGNGDGRCLGLRADFDALPVKEKTGLEFASVNEGVMHACGHDMHTAALLAAARRLQELRTEFRGTVLLAFQQAEEMGHGSSYFEERGLTQGYDRAFGLHIAPDYPVGSVAISQKADAASCDYYKITVHGVSAHTARPHQGKNALLAGAGLVQQIAQLRAEVVDPAERAVIGVGRFAAGTVYNAIANEAVIEGSYRAFSAETRQVLRSQLAKLVAAAELAYGVKVELFTDCFAPATVNAPEARDEIIAVARELLGAEQTIVSAEPVFGFAADDFSVFMQHCPSVYVHVGAARAGVARSARALHSDDFEPDEAAIGMAADLHLNYALAFLGKENK